jgi:hypothetical protein
MERKFQIYLDTSVPNFLFADDAPEKKDITIDLFDNFIKPNKYETYISEVVLAEIEDTKNAIKKKQLYDIIKKYPIEIINLNGQEEHETEELANKYIDAKIIPEQKIADAFHIAISVIKRIDYLVSWNYKHLANINKEKRIKVVNLENNYNHEFRIITPLELIDYGI